MSWDPFVKSSFENKEGVEDAAIACFLENSEGLWGSLGPTFKNITVAEVKRLKSKDRSNFFTEGIMLGGVKCRVITDNLNKEDSNSETDFHEDHVMYLMTKDGNTICVVKSLTAFVMVMGCKSIHGRQLIPHVLSLAQYLVANKQ